MKATVDASVAVKWFVAEPLRDEARLLLARRVHLYASDLLLAEFANTIWKKARRREIPDAEPYLDRLPDLSEIVALRPIGDLVERAARLSREIDHSVYDCLYLACAETTDSTLVAADRRFAERTVARLPVARVRDLGSPGFADWTAAAAPSSAGGR